MTPASVVLLPSPRHDSLYLGLASAAARGGTCPRAKVGCVLVSIGATHMVGLPPVRRVLAVGYNGAPRGLAHCVDVGCDLRNARCDRAEHAERNAVYNAAAVGAATEGAVAYVTHRPCWPCFRALVQAGIRGIVYQEAYGEEDPRLVETAEALGLVLRQVVQELPSPAPPLFTDFYDIDDEPSLGDWEAGGTS